MTRRSTLQHLLPLLRLHVEKRLEEKRLVIRYVENRFFLYVYFVFK